MKHPILQIGPLMPLVESGIDASYEVHRLWKAPDRAAFLAEYGPRIEAVVCSARHPVRKDLIESLPKLKAITVFGVGYDQVDVEAARSRGVLVSNTPDVLTECVADLAIGLLIDTARAISAGDRFTRAGKWENGAAAPLATKVSGKRLGILGLGRIGKAIAKRAEGFDMAIRYNGRRKDVSVVHEFEPDLAALARWSDFFVVACAGGESTRNLVSREVIEAVGPGGILINVSRGTVVVESALVEALASGKLGGAGLDVFEDEPKVPPELLAMENVVLTPHVASATRETRDGMGNLVLKNLRGFFAEGKLRTPV